MRYCTVAVILMLFLRSLPLCAAEIAQIDSSTPALQEVQDLRRQMEEEQKASEAKIEQMQRQMEDQRKVFERRLQEVENRMKESAQAEQIESTTSLLRPPQLTQVPAQPAGQRQSPSGFGRTFQSMNPEISAILDTYYHEDDSKEGIAHVRESIAGFGHSHGGEEHHHHGPEKGFNLRHAEFQFSAEVDPYFKGSAIAAVAEEGAELETAEIETTCLPGGFKLKAGKFFSDFGRINAQHSHNWDFVDQPLIYALTLGDHGLNEKGLQLSWLAPAPFYCLVGAEVFQGENEVMFSSLNEDPLPSRDGPRLGVGWIKFGPELPGRHGLQFGLSGSIGRHQEAHDGDSDGVEDHWLDGLNSFYGADFVYKYDDTRAYGQGDFTLQGEYFYRRKDLEVEAHDLMPSLVGKDKVDNQDGYYLQGTYGFLPRWRTGLRWEQVGLRNSSDLPDGSSESYTSSWRVGPMVEFSPSEFSRLRLQLNHGDYELTSGEKEAVTEVMLQLMISLGTHGAHKF